MNIFDKWTIFVVCVGWGGEKQITECTLTNVPMFQNGTSTLPGEHLCQIILKYMHKCRSYGPDKLNL